MSARPYVERQKAPPSAAGVPRRGQDKPSAHELAILRRVSLGFLMVTQREGKGPLFTYEDGTPIRNERDFELDVAGFTRLARWLDPDRGDSLFGTDAQIWRARRPDVGK
jgi:hypothetical protein